MTTEETKQKDPQAEQLESNVVKLWTKRIKDAKKKSEPDFKRMKENQEFTWGLQRLGQDSMDSKEYVANFVNREVNQRVAALYAHDPKAIAKRRNRLDFQMWDGAVETEQGAAIVMQQAQTLGQVSPQAIQAQALLADVAMGKKQQKLIEKIGRTLEILYQYECDTQTPDFKYQMKQLVRRVIINGVGYVRLNFSRLGDHALTSSGTDDSMSMRIKRAKQILAGIEDDTITEEDPRREQLENLFASVQSSLQNGDMTNVEERLEFDFPLSTSIIVDPRCQSLKGFIGARWIAQQFIIPLEEANAYFESDIKAGGELVTYSDTGIEKIKNEPGSGESKDPQEKPLGCFWEVFDLTTKTHFFLCDGWKKYVQEPQPCQPSINRFWPIFTLTFNDCEVEPGGKISPYPPSDVDLLKHPQKEWNRISEELRKHRKANRPFYLTTAGWLADPDKEKLGDHETAELISVKGIPPNGSLKDNIVKFESAAIDPALYNRNNVMEDATMVVGSMAPQQQPQRHVAATPAVIQEQARVSGVNSNVDDLDDLLSELARASGEMMLREFSIDTVKRIAGVGAVWPEQNREDFLNELFLDVVAASSGRPNKAVDVATAQQLIPLMMQAGANPWAIIQYLAKIMDANIDPVDFAPALPPQAGSQTGPQKPQSKQSDQVGQHSGGMNHPVPVRQN